MMPYVHILLSDLKTWFFCYLYIFCGRSGVASFDPPQAENFWENTGFFTQPAAGQNNFVFWGQNGAIPIYTYFLHAFGGQNDALYTHFGFFGGVKMLPYIHIFGIYLFAKKEKKTIDFTVVFLIACGPRNFFFSKHFLDVRFILITPKLIFSKKTVIFQQKT